MLKLAVLGDPVEHSLSPQIHRHFGRQFGIELDYQRLRTGPEELPERLRAFVEAGGRGVNLTVPLKSAGLRLCQRIDAAARQARAVNTLSFEDGGWAGFNTDGPGLLADFDRLGLDLRGKRVLMLGAGGAAAGILGPLLRRKPAEILILNRSPERAVAMAERFAHLGSVRGAALDHDATAGSFDLLIQATSLGHQGGLPIIRPDWLAEHGVIYDLNYGPAHGLLERWARSHALTCHDGLGMLVGQAALAFEIWTGRRPDMDATLTALREAGPQ
ncbi:shikimate dehydrogenase [Wenzhouxiangella marina]|uniref:Shikimate dehydrogenase (NADP(+)) n=1 Tax=Wenzhouxiangella marina TaxID=1579979 RepID=A0A0K0XSS6_9GAMM|nr:shikimate dehydrogenase [Wenzhouxiangella marina]AKS40728.1 Shikimate dehydrogenase [Wenzhouxiangella marina]MBB6087601.1 shikimate dehydrogenase [Wenzhouxiangella marina]